MKTLADGVLRHHDVTVPLQLGWAWTGRSSLGRQVSHWAWLGRSSLRHTCCHRGTVGVGHLPSGRTACCLAPRP